MIAVALVHMPIGRDPLGEAGLGGDHTVSVASDNEQLASS